MILSYGKGFGFVFSGSESRSMKKKVAKKKVKIQTNFLFKEGYIFYNVVKFTSFDHLKPARKP
jgi:hypothetical protein